MKRRSYLLVEILLLFLISLIAFTWLGRNELLKGVDDQTSFNYKVNFDSVLYEWKDRYGIGQSFSDRIGILTTFIPYVMQINNLGLHQIHVITIWLLFLTSLISSWFFGGVIHGFSRDSRISRLITSGMYTFGVHSFGIAFVLTSVYTYIFAFTPLAIGLYIKLLGGLDRDSYKTIIVKSIILAFIYTLFISFIAAGTNLVFLPLITLVYYIFYILLNKNKEIFKKSLFFNLSIILFLILLNLWWLPGFVFSVGRSHFYEKSVEAVSFTQNSLSQYEIASHFSRLFNIYRNMGHQEYYLAYVFQDVVDPYKGSWQYEFRDSWFYILLTSLPFLVASFSLFFISKETSRKQKSIFLSLYICVLFMIFLSKQGAKPFSLINFNLLSLPYGEIFRHTGDKLGHIQGLFVAGLFGYVLNQVNIGYLINKKYFKHVLSIAVFIVFVFFGGYPLWTGEVIKKDGFVMPGNVAILPDYYNELRTYFENDLSVYRNLHLPIYQGHIAYSWKKGIQAQHDPVDNYFHNKPEILWRTIAYPEERLFLTLINDYFLKSKISGAELFKFLGIYNVEYLVNHFDWKRDYIPRIEHKSYWPEDYDKKLTNSISDNIVKQNIGLLTLYKNKEMIRRPNIYLSDTLIYVTDKMEDIIIASALDKDINNAIYYVPTLNKDQDSQMLNTAKEVRVIGDYIDRTVNLDSVSWDSGWAWPTVNTDPQSVKHKIILSKEEIEVNNEQDRLLKVDRLIWNGTKRIVELKQYSSTPKTTQDNMNIFIKNYSEAADILKNYDYNKKDNSYWGMVVKYLMYMRRSFEDIKTLRLNEKTITELVTLYDSYMQWISKASAISCPGNCYEVNIPKPGEYEVYLQIDSPGNMDGNIIEDKIIIGENEILFKYDPSGNRIQKVGDINIANIGEYVISIPTFSGKNILTDNDWESATQEVPVSKGLDIVSSAYRDVSQKYKHIIADETCNEYLLKFDYLTDRGKLNIAVVEETYDYSKVDENEFYSGDFELSQLKLIKSPIFEKTLSDADYSPETLKYSPHEYCTYREDDKCFASYSKALKPGINVKDRFLFVYGTPEDSKQENPDNLYDVKIRNLSLTCSIIPQVIMRSVTNSTNIVNAQDLPELKFQKINPTRYLIEFENVNKNSNQILLNLSERYDEGWQITKANTAERDFLDSLISKTLNYLFSQEFNYELENEEIIYDDFKVKEYTQKNIFWSEEFIGNSETLAQHFVSNGVLNGWIINTEDISNGDKYYIEFTPQRNFYYGIFLSLVSLLVLGTIMVYLVARIKNDRKN